MEILKDFMEGKISVPEFDKEIKNNKALLAEVNGLIPDEAKCNPNHELWKRYSYYDFKAENFNLYNHIMRITKVSDRIDDGLDYFSTIEFFYRYCFPQAKIDDYYDKAFMTFLEISGDSFDGVDVYDVIENIVKAVLPYKTKKERIAKGKQMIKEAFHVEDNKRPRWIQSCEWPMGVKSPMKYVGRRKIDDGAVFIFRDVDTDEIREVEQFY